MTRDEEKAKLEKERPAKFEAYAKKVMAERLEREIAQQIECDAHDHDRDFLEDCAREDREEARYEAEGYRLASGDYS